MPLPGRSRVPARCSSVVLPDPDGPATATSSPEATARLTPASEGGLNHREPVDLSEITAARLLVSRTEIERQRLRVETSISPATLAGDRDLTERLVANLVDNAMRHNVPGGTVAVATGRRDGRAVLSVANSGPVIPAAEVDRLFQPFQRAAAVRGQHSSGHGLGLSVVRAIAVAHGAGLTADARPEGGLRVEVSFPAGGGAPHGPPPS